MLRKKCKPFNLLIRTLGENFCQKLIKYLRIKKDAKAADESHLKPDIKDDLRGDHHFDEPRHPQNIIDLDSLSQNFSKKIEDKREISPKDRRGIPKKKHIKRGK